MTTPMNRDQATTLIKAALENSGMSLIGPKGSSAAENAKKDAEYLNTLFRLLTAEKSA